MKAIFNLRDVLFPDFWVCERDLKVLSCKWKLLSSISSNPVCFSLFCEGKIDILRFFSTIRMGNKLAQIIFNSSLRTTYSFHYATVDNDSLIWIVFAWCHFLNIFAECEFPLFTPSLLFEMIRNAKTVRRTSKLREEWGRNWKCNRAFLYKNKKFLLVCKYIKWWICLHDYLL